MVLRGRAECGLPSLVHLLGATFGARLGEMRLLGELFGLFRGASDVADDLRNGHSLLDEVIEQLQLVIVGFADVQHLPLNTVREDSSSLLASVLERLSDISEGHAH